MVRSKSVTNRLSLQIVLRGLANPPGSVDVIPTAGCAQCAWCSLPTCVRAWTFLFEAVNFQPLFVCHDKFLTILASIVCYDAMTAGRLLELAIFGGVDA